jgi:hypothetical protein
MLRRVVFVRTDISEEPIVSIIRVARIMELETTSQRASVASYCSPIVFTLMMETILSSEVLLLARATWRHNPEDGILHRYRREYLKCYTVLTG